MSKILLTFFFSVSVVDSSGKHGAAAVGLCAVDLTLAAGRVTRTHLRMHAGRAAPEDSVVHEQVQNRQASSLQCSEQLNGQ